MSNHAKITTKNKIRFDEKNNRYRTSFMYNRKSYDVYGKTEKECEKKLEKKKLEVFSTNDKIHSEIKLITWCNYWLDEIKKKDPHFKKSTYTSYYTAFNTHLVKHKLANIRISDITIGDCTDYVNFLKNTNSKKTGVPLSDKTILNITRPIKAALDYACNEVELIDRNPFKNSLLPKAKKNKRECLTLEEQYALMMECVKNINPITISTLVMLYCGLRRGELIALKVSDLIKKGDDYYFRVTKSLRRERTDAISGKTEVLVIPPKTANGVRDVPIPAPLLFEFKKYWDQVKQDSEAFKVKITKDTYLFKRKPDDPYYDPDTCGSDIKKLILKVSGNDKYSAHTLRHTFCTRWVECGLDLPLLSKIAGHDSYKFTVDNYVHLDKIYKLESNDYSEFFDKLGVTAASNYSGETEWIESSNRLFSSGLDVLENL